MKKKFNQYQRIVLCLIVIGVVFGSILWSKSVHAQVGTWDVSLFGGGAFPANDDIKENFNVGARIAYSILSNFELGVEGSWQKYDDRLGATKLGEVHHFPVFLIGKYHLNFEKWPDKYTPYILLGAGVSFWDYKESLSTIEAENDINFAGKAGLGFDVSMGDYYSVFVEGGYLWAEYNLTGTVSGVSVTGDQRADTAFVNGGVTYNF